jgi:DNA-binding MarR family transcriptional regulator
MQQTGSLQQSLSGQAALLTELLSSALEPHLRKSGLTPATFDLLTAVHASQDGCSQASLARRLRVSAPTLSEAVHAAEERGFLVASKSTSDKRLRVIKLTTVGQRAVEQALKALNQLETQVVEELEDRDVRAAVLVLKRVNQRIAARLRTDAEE